MVIIRIGVFPFLLAYFVLHDNEQQNISPALLTTTLANELHESDYPLYNLKFLKGIFRDLIDLLSIFSVSRN